MPLRCWLLLSALLPLHVAANEVKNNSIGVAIIVFLLLLTISFTLLGRRLFQRYARLERQYRQLQSYLYRTEQRLCVLDHQLRPEYINRSFAAYTGIKLNDSVSEPLPVFEDEHGNVSLAAVILSHLKQHPYWQGEAWVKTGTAFNRISLNLTRLDDCAQPRYLAMLQPPHQLPQTVQSVQSRIRDPETDLLSAEVLMEFLRNAVETSNEQHPRFELLLIRFSPVINADSLGQSPFDIKDVIKELSQVIASIPQAGAIVARYSADTLAVMVPPHRCSDNTDIELNRLAHQILQATEPYSSQRLTPSVQTLIGCSIYPADGTTAQALLNSANKALKIASKLGSSNIQFANPRQQQRSPEYLALEAELHKALVQGEFDVYYQPRVSISSNRIVGYEALLRWHSPKRGILSPQFFLPLADEAGVLVKLDQFVFSRCCEQLQHWQQIGVNRGRVSLNMSTLSVMQPQFTDYLLTQLSETGLQGEQFELELPEEVFLCNDPKVHTSLQQLATLGFQLTVDNFGQGVSSLTALRRAPIHGIKIAAAFINEMEHNEQQRNITASLIRLASYLQLNVVATGIENEMQAYLLHVMGCDVLQGYLFSKALPASEIPLLLTKENKLVRKQVS